jgi:sensor domain CHASE-containing protein
LCRQPSGGDLDFRTVEQTLLNLLVYEFEVVLEGQDLCSDAGDQLGGQGNALTAVFINLDPVAGSRSG